MTHESLMTGMRAQIEGRAAFSIARLPVTAACRLATGDLRDMTNKGNPINRRDAILLEAGVQSFEYRRAPGSEGFIPSQDFRNEFISGLLAAEGVRDMREWATRIVETRNPDGKNIFALRGMAQPESISHLVHQLESTGVNENSIARAMEDPDWRRSSMETANYLSDYYYNPKRAVAAWAPLGQRSQKWKNGMI